MNNIEHKHSWQLRQARSFCQASSDVSRADRKSLWDTSEICVWASDDIWLAFIFCSALFKLLDIIYLRFPLASFSSPPWLRPNRLLMEGLSYLVKKVDEMRSEGRTWAICMRKENKASALQGQRPSRVSVHAYSGKVMNLLMQRADLNVQLWSSTFSPLQGPLVFDGETQNILSSRSVFSSFCLNHQLSVIQSTTASLSSTLFWVLTSSPLGSPTGQCWGCYSSNHLLTWLFISLLWDDTSMNPQSQISNCVWVISIWMLDHQLHLNPGNTAPVSPDQPIHSSQHWCQQWHLSSGYYQNSLKSPSHN